MNNEDRIRACFQHTVLNYVNNQPVNNQSVRKRFNIGKNNTSTASNIISETVKAGLIKPADPESGSKKYASYVPYWV
jgi:predicted HTH transcriptional regulator